MIGSKKTNEDYFCKLVKHLDKQLKSRLAKITYERRMVVILDKASIQNTKKVKLLVKRLGWLYL